MDGNCGGGWVVRCNVLGEREREREREKREKRERETHWRPAGERDILTRVCILT